MTNYTSSHVLIQFSFIDNDPKHTSNVAKEWFKKKKINVLDWCPMSPDLNPIENVWKRLKDRVQARNPTSHEDGWRKAQEEWANIEPEFYAALVDSMPRRLKAVLDNNGYATKY